MKTYADLIEAFTIFMKYAPDETFVIVAEHDIIWTGHAVKGVTPEDLVRLKELGFAQDEGMGGFYYDT